MGLFDTLLGKKKEKSKEPGKIKDSARKPHCEAHHGKGLEGLFKRYFK